MDTSYLIESDTALAIVTDKDADGLELIRHSTAHLLAYAVKELFPDAQVTIGPVIENGFYYDFSYKRPFTPEDLQKIEARMAELAKKDVPIERSVLPRDEAVAYFKSIGENYKAEIIASIPQGEDVSLYKEGAFTDLCRGPHVPSTGPVDSLLVASSNAEVEPFALVESNSTDGGDETNNAPPVDAGSQTWFLATN